MVTTGKLLHVFRRCFLLVFPLALAVAAAGYLLPAPKSEVTLASFSTSLAGRTPAQRRNAILALKKLDGTVIAPGETFSFNRRVGTWSQDQGYRRAPVSYNGTLIASWGGGVCQTSTTLYNAALLAGMEPIERSPHRFSPDYVPPGRDAAVAFDDVDLKFKNPFSYSVKIAGRVENDRLGLSVIGSQQLQEKPQLVSEFQGVTQPRVFRLRGDGGTKFIKNSGKAGCEVWTYRVTGDSRELLSVDNYPVMNKIQEGD